MKNLVFIFLMMMGLSISAFAQKEVEGDRFIDRLYFGGNFGLQFGDYTSIDVSPLVGFMVTDDFSVGMGGTYQYLKYKRFPADFSTSIYGGRLFARHNIGAKFFAHGEYEMLNTDYYNFNENRIRREWVPAAFVGGGYSERLGKGAFSITVLYNLLYDQEKSPYAEPYVIRVGFSL